MEKKVLFEESQYLGRDKSWISVRLILALFCFVASYITSGEDYISQQIFFGVGCLIIVISVIMMYMVQFKTTVYDRNVTISGLWSSRLVKIEFTNIQSVEKRAYSKFFFNNPVYNLHKQGQIRFYAGGMDAVFLTDKDGLIYVIGTQKQDELARVISEQVKLLKR